MFIDTHTHLQFSHYDKDRSNVIELSFSNGVDYIINIGTTFKDSLVSLKIAEQYNNIYRPSTLKV